MLKTIANILEIHELDGVRSMSNLAPEERQRLVNDRAKSVETICVRIKVNLNIVIY